MMANGLPITPAGCLIRNLMRFVDFLPFMYAFAIVLILLRHDARRLGDLAGGTLVAYRNEIAPAGAFGAGDPMPPPVALSARQQAAIAAFAWRASRLTPERAEEDSGARGRPFAARPGNRSVRSALDRHRALAARSAAQSRARNTCAGSACGPYDIASMTPLEFETANEPRWTELEKFVGRGGTRS